MEAATAMEHARRPPVPAYPTLYQVNTRVHLRRLGAQLGRPATLDDISDAVLDGWRAQGYDWLWLLGVWQTGSASRDVSRSNPEWLAEFHSALPDLTEGDIPGSCFAITAYRAHPALGGDAALARIRERLHARGMRLMLDFVPNHMALDHPWVQQHPEFFVEGNEEQLASAPRNWTRVTTGAGETILAFGRDPYFPGWPDTLQLDYGNPQLRAAMTAELLAAASRCDGLRCDMAMLLLPDVFQRTWGITIEQPFWPNAIAALRAAEPDFTLMAEVYWDLEWVLQQQGFNYTYDKRLYDRLRDGHARPVRDHLLAELGFQRRMARFLENHDEPRAARTFPRGQHEAAAVVTYFAPGLRFFHEGQQEGFRTRIPIHLDRGPDEPVDEGLRAFYQRLLAVLDRPVFADGDWRLLERFAAWEGNPSHEGFIAYCWEGQNGERAIVAVNYAPHWGQCYLHLPFEGLAGRDWRLRDLLGDAHYERDGDDLSRRGLYLAIPPWAYHVFELTPVE